MNRSELWLSHIIERINLAVEFAEGIDQAAFAADQKAQGRFFYQIVIIGEAAAKIPDSLRATHPEIDWRKIVGMRNVLAHRYWEADYEIVWEVIQDDLPRLREHIQTMLSDIRAGS